MILLGLNKVSVAFGERELFSDITFTVDEGEHIGLIGSNGTGKTTIMRLITGEQQPTTGMVSIGRDCDIGYMRQSPDYTDKTTLLDDALDVYAGLMETERRLDDIADALTRGEDIDANVDRQAKLMERFEREGGLTYRSRTRSALLGLGFTEDELSRTVDTLSGGQRTRLNLAKLLLAPHDMLLLDEPTNHLDMDAVEWLEGYLRAYPRAFIVISHDRYFLDRVTTRTIELYNRHIRSYDGSYTEYLAKKEALDRDAAKHYEHTQREIRRIEGIIAQQRRFNQERNYVTIRAKQKEIDRLSRGMVAPEAKERKLRFDMAPVEEGGNEVLNVSGLAKSFDGKPVFANADMQVRRGEHIFVIGPNGCGKSTMLNIITGRLKQDAGRFSFGSRISVGYYDQRMADLAAGNDAMGEIRSAYPRMTDGEIRSALAVFDFRGDDVFLQVGDMSGGEKARLALLKLILSHANFLILDEPTNHLDINAREALTQALTDYEGTLLIVSHDRYLINKLCDRLYHMRQNGLTEYLGNYDFYHEKASISSVSAEEAKAPRKKSDYAEQRERESQERRRLGEMRRIEERIAELEAQIEGSSQELMESGETDYNALLERTAKIEGLRSELDGLYERWSELESQGKAE